MKIYYHKVLYIIQKILYLFTDLLEFLEFKKRNLNFNIY